MQMALRKAIRIGESMDMFKPSLIKAPEAPGGGKAGRVGVGRNKHGSQQHHPRRSPSLTFQPASDMIVHRWRHLLPDQGSSRPAGHENHRGRRSLALRCYG